jgi:hypothetical protein
MPATFDANGYTILNTPSQRVFDDYCVVIGNGPQRWISTEDYLRLVMSTMRAEGYNGAFGHLEYRWEPLPNWGLRLSELTPDNSTPVSEKAKLVDISNETFCYCDSCKAKRCETNGLARRQVHAYNYTPARWRMHSVTNDKFPYHMGVELETTAYHRDHLDNGFAVDMKRPKQFWVAKRDGSVSGPEFASHPATLTWWHENQGNLADMFKMLTHAGFTSHNGGQAGMHVNISRNAFSDADHLYRFMRLVTMRPDWSIQMAQRSFDKANSWAKIFNYSQDLCNEAVAHGSRYLTNKYSVVNVQRTRYEFRLPRGSLRLDRFMKNLEWTAAMIGFARQNEEVSEINPATFMEWARNFPTVYANLNSFVEEKKDALIEALDRNSDTNARYSNLPA